MTYSPPTGLPQIYKGKPFRFAWTCKNAAGAIEWIEARYDDGERKENPPFIPNGKGLKNEAPPAPRTLYGLDTLNDAPANCPRFVVEGPKKAAALHSLGLPAVASLGGAQSAHKSNWKPLEGFLRVVIMPDNDNAGEDYVRAVVGILAALPGNREVVIVRLPGLPEHGDIVDFLQSRVPSWDGFGAIPREPGDDLQAELLEAVDACAEPPPVEWLTPAAPAVEDWETPVPLDAATIPEWPRDVFPEPVQRFIDALSAATETPPELPSMIALAVLATAAQGRYRVNVKPGYFQPLNLWTCAVLPPASRKSEVFRAAIQPLAEWQSTKRVEIEPQIKRAESERKTLQGRIDRRRADAAKAKPAEVNSILQDIEALENDLPQVPTLPRLWVDDCTPEHVATLLAENQECLSVLSSEGGIFQLIAGRYAKNGGPNLQVFLQAHEGDPHIVDRGSRAGVFLKSPALSFGVTIQPDVLRSFTLTPEFLGRGLLGRFFFVVPESRIGKRTLNTAPVSDEVRRDYAAVVEAMLDTPIEKDTDGNPCAHVLRLSPEAATAWAEFAHKVEAQLGEGGTFQHITSWAGKLPGAVARIAAALHVARHANGKAFEHSIGGDDMAAAIRLGEVLGKHALIAFDEMAADAALNDARKILTWIQRESRNTFTRRDCHNANQSRFRRAEEMDAPLDVLAERGYIRPKAAPITTGVGRPKSRTYEVNPACLGGADA